MPCAEGFEYFLSFETADEAVIFGFLRLRLSMSAGAGTFPELEQAALVRELHVYGQLVATNDRETTHAQHIGFGTRLMAEAERLARQHGYSKIAVIAGVGTRNYYRRLGYQLQGPGAYLIKRLPRAWLTSAMAVALIVALLLAILAVQLQVLLVTSTS